jgi:DNA-binding LacI/PurR family transcriptional regulator
MGSDSSRRHHGNYHVRQFLPVGAIIRSGRGIALARRGLDLRSEHVVAVRDVYGQDTPERLKPLLALPAAQRPTALFCTSDSIAIQALTGLLMAGVKCPEELSVLGAENTPFIENTRPPLSTLEVPMEKDGAMCVEQVIRAWGKTSKSIQLASEIGLVERESVSVPRG